jgi:hypothetical protein
VATAAALAWADGSAIMPRDAGRAEQGGARLFLAMLVAAFVAYLLGLLLLRRRAVTVAAVVALGVGIQLAPLAAPLLLSTDAWTYWEYGWIANEGHDPYETPPEQFPSNPAYPYAGADWRDTTSVYGPAFTLASQPLAAVAGESADAAAWLFKGLAGLAAVAATVLAARLSRSAAFAAAFVGWNPLLALHLAGGGHNDAWLAAGILGALALAAAGRQQLAGAAWALVILVKWVPAIFFALRALEAQSRGRRLGSAGFAVASLVVGVLAVWRFGIDWVSAFGPLATNAGTETSYALPHRLEQLGLPDVIALGLAGAVLAVGLAWLARAAWRGRARLAPAVPLAAVEDDARSRLAVLALCAYLLPQTIPL